jgi:hypothetical protein
MLKMSIFEKSIPDPEKTLIFEHPYHYGLADFLGFLAYGLKFSQSQGHSRGSVVNGCQPKSTFFEWLLFYHRCMTVKW